MTEKSMQAVVFENRKITLKEVPVPILLQNEALVKVHLAGICATDFALLKGYHKFSGTPGHEFTGVVVSAPDRPDLEGVRVTADINCGCGQCDICRTGDPRHCRGRSVIGIRGRSGVFAEFCAIPIQNLCPVPDGIADEEAVFAEPLAAAIEITRQVEIKKNSRVAVLGDGKMGLLSAFVLKQKTTDLTLIGRHPEKLDIAGRQGIRTICSSPGSPVKISGSGPAAFDLVVDATGSPDGINAAIGLVRPEGTVVIKTTTVEKPVIDIANVVVNELHLIGSRCGDVRLAIAFMEKKEVDLHLLVEAVYPLKKFEKAFAHAAQKESLKILIHNTNGIKSQK